MKQEVSLGGRKRDTYWRQKNYFVKKGHRQNQFEVKIKPLWSRQFYGANKGNCCWNWAWGLSETFTKPNWLGIEVTNDNRYNSNLKAIRLNWCYYFKTSIVTVITPVPLFFAFPWKLFGRSISLDFTKGPLSVTSTITVIHSLRNSI
jgi:hypothetical protein